MMDITGHTILITGGTSGIGLGFAQSFLRSGNRVIICGRRKDRLEQIRKASPGMEVIACDLEQDDERKRLADRVVREFPGTNILMNNAGIQLRVDLRRPVDLACVRSEVEINLVAPLHLGSLMAGHLASKKESALINITSGLAFTPMAFAPVYCATKAAMHSLTLSLRYQLKNTPIKVFEIIPPSVDTELGFQHRGDKHGSHGGLTVSEFVEEALWAIANDILEAPIGAAKGLHEKREALFDMINQ
jgi:uncharacterized oxidoreductase